MISRLGETQVRALAFLGALVAILVGGFFSYWIGGFALAFIIISAITMTILILAPILRRSWWGRTRIQYVTLLLFSSATISVLSPNPPWLWPASKLLDYFGVSSSIIPFWQGFLLLVLLGGVLIALNLIWERQRVLPMTPAAPQELNDPFPEDGYTKLRDKFSDFMRSQLDRYDLEVEWSDSEYTPLEAEVEMDRRGASRPRVLRNLTAAIRRDHLSRAFLLLGDPGSGKSVSLRRLCRELYRAVPHTGIVPVYVNLREWNGPAEPTDGEIAEFILRYLKDASGRAGMAFLDRWYWKMLNRGLLFFLLDSFDEMPSVIDCDDQSPQLIRISRAFDRFFHDMHECRGVLVSRPFRQPRGFRGRKLTIRPFSEKQIHRALRGWLLGYSLDPNTIIRKLFTERPELIPTLRNPFTGDLVTQYIIHHNGELPPSYYSIFENYITRRLAEEDIELKSRGLTPEQVSGSATTIAWAMYSSPNIGLEADVSRLRDLVTIERLDDNIRILRIARIVRLGGVKEQRLSFVHRRFAEFFVVRRLIETGDTIPPSTIPHDSRWRDCLLVYCGVAPSAEATRIADYCWAIIGERIPDLQPGFTEAARPAIHCLRFIRDGYQSRPQCLHGFLGELSQTVLALLRSSDLLVVKLGAEILALVTPEARSEGIKIAFESGVPWISETAFRVCRRLWPLEIGAKQAIRSYVRSIPTPDLIRGWRDLSFSLSLSDGLTSQRVALYLDILSLLSLWILVPIWALLMKPADMGLPTYAILTLCLLLFWEVMLRSEATDFKGQARTGFDTSVRLLVLSLTVLWLTPIPNYLTGSRSLPSFNVSQMSSVLEKWLITVGTLEAYTVAIVLSLVTGVVVMPWEVWHSIMKATGAPRSAVARIRSIHLTEFASMICSAVLGVLVASGVWFLAMRYKIVLGLLSVLAGALLVLWLVGYVVIPLWSSFKDWRDLKRLRLPGVISSDWLYETCGRFRSTWGRRRFIVLIRNRNIPLIGQISRLPDVSWATTTTRGEIARLREKWLGLEE